MNAKAEIGKAEFNVLCSRKEYCEERERAWIERLKKVVDKQPNYFAIIPEKQYNAILQLNRIIDERILGRDNG